MGVKDTILNQTVNILTLTITIKNDDQNKNIIAIFLTLSKAFDSP